MTPPPVSPPKVASAFLAELRLRRRETGGGVKWKTTLALLIVTVAVGVYVSRYELTQPTTERREELAKQVVRINADDVTALTAELPDGKVALVLHDGLWHLAGPLQGQADESLVRRALSELDPLTAERVLEGTNNKPLVLAEFGLDPPRGIVTVTTKEGKTVTVWLGDPTPVEDRRYAALPGSPRVFVVSHGLFDELNRHADAFAAPPVSSPAKTDEGAGAPGPLEDRGVDEDAQERQRPPE